MSKEKLNKNNIIYTTVIRQKKKKSKNSPVLSIIQVVIVILPEKNVAISCFVQPKGRPFSLTSVPFSWGVGVV